MEIVTLRAADVIGSRVPEEAQRQQAQQADDELEYIEVASAPGELCVNQCSPSRFIQPYPSTWHTEGGSTARTLEVVARSAPNSGDVDHHLHPPPPRPAAPSHSGAPWASGDDFPAKFSPSQPADPRTGAANAAPESEHTEKSAGVSCCARWPVLLGVLTAVLALAVAGALLLVRALRPDNAPFVWQLAQCSVVGAIEHRAYEDARACCSLSMQLSSPVERSPEEFDGLDELRKLDEVRSPSKPLKVGDFVSFTVCTEAAAAGSGAPGKQTQEAVGTQSDPFVCAALMDVAGLHEPYSCVVHDEFDRALTPGRRGAAEEACLQHPSPLFNFTLDNAFRAENWGCVERQGLGLGIDREIWQIVLMSAAFSVALLAISFTVYIVVRTRGQQAGRREVLLKSDSIGLSSGDMSPGFTAAQAPFIPAQLPAVRLGVGMLAPQEPVVMDDWMQQRYIALLPRRATL